MSAIEIVIVIWLLLLSIGFFLTARAIIALYTWVSEQVDAADEAKKMLRWGLDQRKTSSQRNVFVEEGRKALKELGEAQDGRAGQ